MGKSLKETRKLPKPELFQNIHTNIQDLPTFLSFTMQLWLRGKQRCGDQKRRSYNRDGQLAAPVPQVTQGACGMQQTGEATDSTAGARGGNQSNRSGRAQSRKQSSGLGTGREAEWHLGEVQG